MLGTLAREGPTTSNHKHIKKSEFTIKVTRAVNADYKLRAGIDDEWVYVPARKNKVVQCNEEDIDAEIDEGFVEDLKTPAHRPASAIEEGELAKPAPRTASALEEGELAPDVVEKKKKRR